MLNALLSALQKDRNDFKLYDVFPLLLFVLTTKTKVISTFQPASALTCTITYTLKTVAWFVFLV